MFYALLAELCESCPDSVGRLMTETIRPLNCFLEAPKKKNVNRLVVLT